MGHQLNYMQHSGKERPSPQLWGLATGHKKQNYRAQVAAAAEHGPQLNYLQHREEKVAADLSLIASLLATSRHNGTIGDMGASYTQQASLKGASKPASAKSVASASMRQAAHATGKPCHC